MTGDNIDNKEPDPILSAIGSIGRWQMKWFFITGFLIVPGTHAIFVITFMNAKTDFWCARPDHLVDVLSVDNWRNLSGQPLHGDSCQMLDLGVRNITDKELRTLSPVENRSYIRCPDFEFDRSNIESTIVMEWNLVCQDQYKMSIGQSVTFIGMCIGVLIVGILCDKYGRKPTLAFVVLLVSVSGIITTFMPNFESFLLARFISSQGSIGSLIVVMAFLMEITGGTWAIVLGIALEYYWDFAWLTLGGLAMYITNWRHLLLILSIPGILLAPLCWYMPESPRWLAVHGKIQEAEETVKKAAKYNGRPLPEDFQLPTEDNKTKTYEDVGHDITFWDLFKYPQLRAKTLILYFNCFSNSLTYYGLILNSGDLNPDIYTNFMINGALEVPAISLGIMMVIMSGRRKLPYASCLFLSGLFLLIMTFVPKDEHGITVMILSMIGKFFVTISFATIYPYASELFPTVLRTTGVGSCSMFSKTAGAMASWVALLTHVNVFVPTTIYGILALVASGLALMLPESQVNSLPDTIEEEEKIKIWNPFRKPDPLVKNI